MIPIARPILGEEDLAAVKEVLASGMLAQGPKVKAFEAAFARDLGRKHGIAVANGTAALHIALLAHNIGTGGKSSSRRSRFSRQRRRSSNAGRSRSSLTWTVKCITLTPRR